MVASFGYFFMVTSASAAIPNRWWSVARHVGPMLVNDEPGGRSVGMPAPPSKAGLFYSPLSSSAQVPYRITVAESVRQSLELIFINARVVDTQVVQDGG